MRLEDNDVDVAAHPETAFVLHGACLGFFRVRKSYQRCLWKVIMSALRLSDFTSGSIPRCADANHPPSPVNSVRFSSVPSLRAVCRAAEPRAKPAPSAHLV